MPFPYIFTFYSYKGGVGRSLALMNVAYRLAGWGRHVLMVDMDLEAPGISGFLDRTGELAEPESAHPKDVLTLLGEAIKLSSADSEAGHAAKKIPALSNYIRSVSQEKLASLRPRMGQLGRLDVLGADLSRDYMERLSQLPINELAQEKLIALSALLHRYFKGHLFPHRPLGIEDFEPPIPTPYDYILVDSRTGITEIGGLCVGPLADRLIVVMSLNDQNVKGTLAFLEEAGIKPQARSEQDVPWDDADPVRTPGDDKANLGPKPTIVVASPTPAGEIDYKRKRLEELRNLLGVRPVQLSYHPQMALMESIFVRDYGEEYLTQQYTSLAGSIMTLALDDPQRLASDVQALWAEGRDFEGAISKALRVPPHIPELGASVLVMLANASLPGVKHLTEIRHLYALLAQDSQTKALALLNWGVALSEQAKTMTAEAADQLFEESYRKFAEAFRLKPDDFSVLNNWGLALLEQAKTKTGEAADQLFEESYRKFAEAFRLKPDDFSVVNNWGLALLEQAKTKTGEAADQLFEESYRKFAEAFRLKRDDSRVLNNWGVALSEQAKTKTGEVADQLFKESYRKYPKRSG